MVSVSIPLLCQSVTPLASREAYSAALSHALRHAASHVLTREPHEAQPLSGGRPRKPTVGGARLPQGLQLRREEFPLGCSEAKSFTEQRVLIHWTRIHLQVVGGKRGLLGRVVPLQQPSPFCPFSRLGPCPRSSQPRPWRFFASLCRRPRNPLCHSFRKAIAGRVSHMPPPAECQALNADRSMFRYTWAQFSADLSSPSFAHIQARRPHQAASRRAYFMLVTRPPPLQCSQGHQGRHLSGHPG